MNLRNMALLNDKNNGLDFGTLGPLMGTVRLNASSSQARVKSQVEFREPLQTGTLPGKREDFRISVVGARTSVIDQLVEFSFFHGW